MEDGIPELNLPSLEPMFIDSIDFIDQEGGKDIRAKFTDVNVYGFSTFDIKNLDIDPKRLTLNTEMSFPSLYMNGTYVMDGSLHIVVKFNLNGQGTFWTSLDNVQAFGYNKLDLISKGGDDFLQVKSTDIDFNAKTIKLHLNGLYPGKPHLSSVMNDVLNDNAQELLKQFKPKLGEILNRMVKDVLNDALSALPIANIGIYRNQK